MSDLLDLQKERPALGRGSSCLLFMFVVSSLSLLLRSLFLSGVVSEEGDTSKQDATGKVRVEDFKVQGGERVHKKGCSSKYHFDASKVITRNLKPSNIRKPKICLETFSYLNIWRRRIQQKYT